MAGLSLKWMEGSGVGGGASVAGQISPHGAGCEMGFFLLHHWGIKGTKYFILHLQ